ncbi:hypothetical protein EYF80_008516 [Liparis tanakae]|uniref:Uncharacterized protein n=1 Tax=Liparis tanakae TaxID=230148 RepID=A0A4Z2IV82_9TELE|nr:hypothetical protein EYF80_008516 [Liparis tanakae]
MGPSHVVTLSLPPSGLSSQCSTSGEADIQTVVSLALDTQKPFGGTPSFSCGMRDERMPPLNK